VGRGIGETTPKQRGVKCGPILVRVALVVKLCRGSRCKNESLVNYRLTFINSHLH
jgi:hypothetical protein